MQIYVVQSGDTVVSIAEQFQVLSSTIIFDNQLIYPYILAVGQSLLISDGIPREDKRLVVINGYAYPFISPYVLTETLPYLSELSIFSYGFTPEGDLVPPTLDDIWMIDEAVNFRTLPILTLTPFGPDGRFSNHLISLLVNNDQAIQNLIQQLIRTIGNKGYGGLDIDFEYILAEDRDKFTDFVRRVTVAMNSLGYQVSVALAPKTSDTQQGLLYEGKDYAALGAIANHVLIMTYEWGYTYAHT